MINNHLTYDDFLEDSEWCRGSPHQDMHVIINGKEYKITDWYPDCDPVIDPSNPYLREECNHRIVFEIEEKEVE